MRGTDSTGAASVKRGFNNNKAVEVVVAKEVGHVYNLLNNRYQKEYDFIDVMASQHRALLGHCRASTRGASTRSNAHPFDFETIVGTHNGTLGYQSHKELKGYLRYDTDSEAIFNEIDLEGVSALMPKLKGYPDPKSNVTCEDAYALVWYDSKDNTINFLRNKERPLWFTFDKDHKQLFWSSEANHLFSSMVDVPKDDKDKFWELPADRHYSWVIPDVGKPFSKPKVVVREGKRITVPFTAKSNVASNHQKHQYQNKQSLKNSTTHSSILSDSDTSGDARVAWKKAKHEIWQKFNQVHNKFKHGASETGPFYWDIQKAWNDLSFSERCHQTINKDMPDGVVSNIIYDEKKCEWVEKDKPVVSTNRAEITAAAKKLKDRRPQTMAEQIKQDKLKPIIAHDKEQGYIQDYAEGDYALFRNSVKGDWLLYTFMGHAANPPWDRQVLTKVPEIIPFTELDVNARHCYKHRGKGRKRITYYRGYKKEMIVQQAFETKMLGGCLHCNRQPRWGNEVHFVNSDLFLCQFCMKQEELVKKWKDVEEMQFSLNEEKRIVN